MAATAPARTPKMTQMRKKKESKINWSHQQGPFLGAFNAGAAALAVAAVGSVPEIGLDWWWPVAAGAVGATAAGTRAVTSGAPVMSRIYRPARWIAYTGWCAWALASGGPWDMTMVGALAAGTVAAAVLQPAARSWELAEADRRAAEERLRVRAGIAGEWEARLTRICKLPTRPGVRVTDLNEWDLDDPHNPGQKRCTGMSIVLELPPGPTSWRTIRSKAEALAADADLPDGCGVEVMSYGSRRKVLLLISTLNALAETIPAGEDYSPLSIYDDLPVGMYHDGSWLTYNLKWVCMSLIGATGSGKSAHLAAIMRQLLRCVDTLVVGIDLNGGKAFRPWLKPWLEGKASKPAIDWVAPTVEEAHLMLDWLLAAIPARTSGYAELMASVNDDKVPASPGLPHITVITDETADLPASIKAKLVELSNRSRAASIRSLTCALRAVSEGGAQMPKALLVQSQLRTAMRVNEETELQRMFGFSRGLPKADQMPEAGYGLHQAVPAAPRIFKGVLVKPSDAEAAAIATDERRPLMDETTIEGAGREVYEKRWERAVEIGWLGKNVRLPDPPARPAEPTEQPTTSAGPAAPRPRTSLADLDLKGAAERARQTRRQLEEAARARRQGDDGVDGDGFEAIVRNAGLRVRPLPQLLLVVREAATDEGVHTKTISERTGLDAARVRELLSLVGLNPEPNPFRVEPGGEKLRGFKRSEIERIAAGIELGDILVPDELRDAL